MADSSNNNTTVLQEGTIGTRRNLGSGIATDISKSISKGNLEASLKTDQKIKTFYNYVFNMVYSSWSTEDMLAVLTEYGDAHSIMSRNGKIKKEEIAAATATSLIINLDPSDLRKLVQDVRVQQEKLKKDVKEIENRRLHNSEKFKRNMRSGSYFNVRTFEEVYERTRGLNKRDREKAIRNFDNTYRIPKNLKNQYTNLRRELKDVLHNTMNKIELVACALSMGIDVQDGMTQKEIESLIIDKTVLYVDLIVGRSKKSYAGVIMDSKPYDDLLQYTSFYYVTGKPGIGDNEWREKRDAAKRAKKAISERNRIKNKRSSIHSSYFKEISGLNVNSERLAARAIRDGRDTGILNGASIDELLNLAGKYGVVINRKTNIYKAKTEIYRAMAADAKRKQRLTNIYVRNAKDGKLNKNAYDLLSLRGDIPKDLESTSNNVPIVNFNKTGDIISKSILKAVPVILVGQSRTGTFDDKKEDIFVDKNLNSLQKELRSFGDFISDRFNDTRNLFSLRNNPISRGIKATGRSIGKAINKTYKLFRPNEKLPNSEIPEYNNESNYERAPLNFTPRVLINNNDFIPRISFNNGSVSIEKIIDVVPVYVVNNRTVDKPTDKPNDKSGTSDLMKWGSGGTNTAKYGKRNRKLLFEEYDKKFGTNSASSDGIVDITDIANVTSANLAVGRGIKKYPLGNAGIFKEGQQYQMTKATAQWAIDNNKKFATGGITHSDAFITGDALGNNIFKGGAKPELVEVQSKSPIVSKITPLKKFATGGVSLSSTMANMPIVGKEYVDNLDIKIKNNFKFYDLTAYASTEAIGAGLNSTIKNALVQPVYVINKQHDETAAYLKSVMPILMTGLSTEIVAAPFGTGMVSRPGLLAGGITLKVKDIADQAAETAQNIAMASLNVVKQGAIANTGANITRMKTGGLLKMSTGGTTAITGDGSTSNIFKGGAKPELVSSNGDMKITPLNKYGKENRQRVSRMTVNERKEALATGISSHIIKFSEKLSSGVTEVSNIGEAIKVYDVKPGITDIITVGQTQTSLVEMLASIVEQLSLITGVSQNNSQLLSTIASNSLKQNTPSKGISQNPFVGFPNSLDGILSGV